MNEQQLEELISQLTLEEKASLCSGADFWKTKAIERLGIPAVKLADGPHGLRNQEESMDHLGLNDSKKAVCFPTGSTLAASFDREMAELLGKALGNECQAEGISTILGPSMNIKRSPLCGRNFEYYSEDPLVSSEMATAYVKGVQSKNVGTSPKHFLANNQEYHRMTSSSEMDERTMREIYLSSFEGVVKQAKPWTMMSSYNRLNGTYLCEHKEVLTDILRNEWGFDGYVMTDWGAMTDRVTALKSGCDLEMPAPGGETDEEIVAAVKDGSLDEDVLDNACRRMLRIFYRFTENQDKEAVFDYEADHEIARKIAEESLILLKNEDRILPLNAESKVAFIGKYAVEPRYQGGGSSHINSSRVESAFSAVGDSPNVTYAKGFEDNTDTVDEKLFAEAVKVAAASEVTVIFAGLPNNFESEGYDRKHLRMPECQNSLIEAIAAVQPNLIVVLHNGAPVEMPWLGKVKAVLETYLGGQAIGGAVANVLYGQVNPSGRLPETFPLRLEDTPCYLTFGGEKDITEYREGVFVGYRYYNSKKLPVLFPFGYGLSYTTFVYNNLKLNRTKIKESEKLTIQVDITNTGSYTGKEVVQLYVSEQNQSVIRPLRELRAFDKVELQSGETKTVTFVLDYRAFAYWNMEIHDWYTEDGYYEIQIGKSAEDIVLKTEVHVESEKTLPRVYTLNSMIGQIMADSKGKMIMEQAMMEMTKDTGASEHMELNDDGMMNAEMMEAMMESMPLRQLLSFIPGLKKKDLLQLIAVLNE